MQGLKLMLLAAAPVAVALWIVTLADKGGFHSGIDSGAGPSSVAAPKSLERIREGDLSSSECANRDDSG